MNRKLFALIFAGLCAFPALLTGGDAPERTITVLWKNAPAEVSLQAENGRIGSVRAVRGQATRRKDALRFAPAPKPPSPAGSTRANANRPRIDADSRPGRQRLVLLLPAGRRLREPDLHPGLRHDRTARRRRPKLRRSGKRHPVEKKSDQDPADRARAGNVLRVGPRPGHAAPTSRSGWD